MSVLYFILVFVLGKRVTKSQVDEIEEEVMGFINRNYIKPNTDGKANNMMEDFDNSCINVYEYDQYDYNNYFSYLLPNGKLVESIDLVVNNHVRGSDGVETVNVFNGQFIKLKNNYKFKSKMAILCEEDYLKFEELTGSRVRTSSKYEVILDNMSFEKAYKVCCDDANYAYEILTADVMEMLTEYKNKIGVNFDVALVGDNIYIKIFENLIGLYSNSLNNPLKRSTFEYFIKKIRFSLDFVEELERVLAQKG